MDLLMARHFKIDDVLEKDHLESFRALMREPAMTIDGLFLPYQNAWIKDETRTAIVEKSPPHRLHLRRGVPLGRAAGEARHRSHLRQPHQGDRRGVHRVLQDVRAVFGVVAEDLGEQPIVRAATSRATRSASPPRTGGAPASSRCRATPTRSAASAATSRWTSSRSTRNSGRAEGANASAKIWGHNVRIISTHNGEGSLFNKLIQEYRAGKRDPTKWSLHSVTLQEAVDQGLVGKILGRGHARGPRGVRRRRAQRLRRRDRVGGGVLLHPQHDASAFLSYELIDAARDPA
jgi:hypothetical protein